MTVKGFLKFWGFRVKMNEVKGCFVFFLGEWLREEDSLKGEG